MHLSPEDIAAAEACGITFLLATPSQVQRLSMQRKVFYRAGEPILATRGGGFYETVGTLQQLIEEGLQQQRDLAGWLQDAAPPEAIPEIAPAVLLTPPAEVVTPQDGVPAPVDVAEEIQPVMPRAEMPAEALNQELAPKRARKMRRSREPTSPPTSPWVEVASAWEPVEIAGDPASDEMPPAVVAPAFRAAVPSGGEAVAERGPQAGARWLVAGAARRGRAGKHWSTRQK